MPPLTRPIAAALLLLNLAACKPQTSALEQIRTRGELRVATLNQPTSYYLGAQGAQGYEYRLASAFAKRLDVQLVILPARDNVALRELLESGDADLAAAQLTADESWKRVGWISNTYRQVAQLVVHRRGAPRAHDVVALRGARLVVRAGSPQLQLLRDLRGNGAPYLAWTELPHEQADPLDWISSNDADFAIVDETGYRYARFLNPETVVAFRLPDPRPLQWVVRRDGRDLRDAVNAFFADAGRTGTLTRVEREADAELHDFEYLEAQRYKDDIAQRLPALRDYFIGAAAANNLDWRLLAAIGYQESKWHANAGSDDGAAGIMMLTESTAAAMGVKDRLNAGQSIMGGAKYFAQVRQLIPERIREPDRTWLAFAAYNVGFGHLEDARILAQSRGRDPDSWADVSACLPLLAEERWYLPAKRGYARGWEPVKFVEQVRGFLSVLEWSGTDASSASALTPVSASTPGKKLP
jgi:membrane-bound lytic murein transglycosylase F